MGKKATAADGELILKLYDLRREPVMRQARADMIAKFVPKSWDEMAAVMKGDHPLNTAYRMVSSYWEMAASLAKHGALNAELLAPNFGEGYINFAKVEPHLPEMRKTAPTAYLNTEWFVKSSKDAKLRFELMRKRVAGMTAKP
ncbi:MAG TPA: hypothetical protein VE981_15730 [Planctomycetota bacterium]|nr:hypothetical protein [Planctomycetota bacterium]